MYWFWVNSTAFGGREFTFPVLTLRGFIQHLYQGDGLQVCGSGDIPVYSPRDLLAPSTPQAQVAGGTSELVKPAERAELASRGQRRLTLGQPTLYTLSWAWVTILLSSQVDRKEAVQFSSVLSELCILHK